MATSYFLLEAFASVVMTIIVVLLLLLRRSELKQVREIQYKVVVGRIVTTGDTGSRQGSLKKRSPWEL